MVRPDRETLASTAPLHDLLALVLRQFRRPLEAYGVALSVEDVRETAQAAADRRPPDERARQVRDSLVMLVEESERVLRQWDLSFTQALETGMDAMPGWATTAEFLEIANEKSNAELRIAAGAAVVTALGDHRYLPHLLYLAGRDDDFETVLARRVLALVSGINPQTPDWLAAVGAWAAQQSDGSSPAL